MNRKSALLWRLALYSLAVVLLLCIPCHVAESGSLCIIYHLTGYRCPMCGMTRAFSNAMHFDFSRAFSFNPLVILFFPLFWFLYLDDFAALVSLIRGRGYRSTLEKIWYRDMKKPRGDTARS